MKTNSTTYVALGLGIVVGALGLASIQETSLGAKAEPQNYGKPIAGISTEDMAALRSLDASFASLAAYVAPSVVHIRAESERGTDLMGRRMGTTGGEGSGVIFRPDGWIITNDHVVGGFEKVTVVLTDGREFIGKVTRAAESDLAVVKIDAEDLPAAQFGDSSTVRPGQFAMAVGSPFGFENSVTFGHISAVGRQSAIPDARLPERARMYPELIQTDTAINMGNSGGPLVNVDGQVIGINSAIYSGTGTNIGIGLAIPSNLARRIADTLITKGKVVRGYLGVVPENLKEYQKKEMKLDGGAILAQVPNDGPAAIAGLKQGDVIVKIGSQPIRTQTDVRMSLLDHEPGSKVRVEFIRNGATKTAEIKVGDPKDFNHQQAAPQRQRGEGSIPEFLMPEQGRQQPGEGVPPVRTGKARLGVEVQTLDATSRSQFKIPADVSGVVVISVVPGSVAERLGWQPGTVLMRVGDKDIKSAQDLTDAMANVEWGQTKTMKFGRFTDNSSMISEIPVTF